MCTDYHEYQDLDNYYQTSCKTQAFEMKHVSSVIEKINKIHRLRHEDVKKSTEIRIVSEEL